MIHVVDRLATRKYPCSLMDVLVLETYSADLELSALGKLDQNLTIV